MLPAIVAIIGSVAATVKANKESKAVQASADSAYAQELLGLEETKITVQAKEKRLIIITVSAVFILIVIGAIIYALRKTD